MCEAARPIDPDAIRSWADARATALDSRAGGPLPCAINLPKPEPEPLDWDAFFDIFADHWMAKFYRNQTGRDDPILREG